MISFIKILKEKGFVPTRKCLNGFLHSPILLGVSYLCLISIFSIIYWFNSGSFEPCTTYIDSIYFSVVTITTLGYGDILPLTGLMKIAVSLEALIGIAFFGLLLNAFAYRLSNQEKLRRDIAIKKSLVGHYENFRHSIYVVLLDHGNLERLSESAHKLPFHVCFREFRDMYVEGGGCEYSYYNFLKYIDTGSDVVGELKGLYKVFCDEVKFSLAAIGSDNTEAIDTLREFQKYLLELENDPRHKGVEDEHFVKNIFNILAMLGSFNEVLDEDRFIQAIASL